MQRLLTLVLLTLTFGSAAAADRIVYYHTDALGSVVAATDEQGDLLWRESYKPFGDRLDRQVSTKDNSAFFTGKPHDDTIGLSYFGARYYDPEVGRFTGIDPAGVDPANINSFSCYVYANNNPYRFVDPNGQWAEDAVLAGPGIVLGGYSLQKNINQGNYLAATVDAVGIGLDFAAAAAPGIPGGAGLAIKAYRETGEVVTKGLGSNANFAQKTFSETFSAGGKFAGQTINDVAGALRSGSMKASDVPIDFITRNGNTLILNTRSAQALTRAGIPRSQWNAVNRTGQSAYEARLTGQLNRNRLTDQGIPTVRPSGGN